MKLSLHLRFALMLLLLTLEYGVRDTNAKLAEKQ